MANMCMNLLKVDGPKAEVDRFAATVATADCPLDFNKAVPMPPEFSIPEDGSTPYPEGMSKEELLERLLAICSSDSKDRPEPLNWDEWRLINWGTKWPPADVHGDSWKSGIQFETRWSPPMHLVDNLSAMFPALRFALSYCEQLEGFAGRAQWDNGKRVEDDSTNDRKDPLFSEIYAEDFGGDAATLDLEANRSLNFTVSFNDSAFLSVTTAIETAADGTISTKTSAETPDLAKIHAEAQQGVAEAQLRLAICHLENVGVYPADPAQGMKWLRKAVEQNLPDAEYVLAVWSLLNNGVAMDRGEALESLHLLEEQRFGFAGLCTGILDASGFPWQTESILKPDVKRGQDEQTTPAIRLPFQHPDPARAAALALRALVVGYVSQSESVKLLEEAIRLDQINALDHYLSIRAVFCQDLGNENPWKALRKYDEGINLSLAHQFDEAEAAYKEAAGLDPLFLWPLNNLAWVRATQADPAARAGKKAVRYAREACIRSNWNCWALIGTMAAAYAAAGDFEQAVDCQRASLALIPDSHRAECEESLACLLEGKPIVDNGMTVAAGEQP